MQMRHRILRKHRDIIRIDQFRYSVVHFRVNVVWASGEDDSAVAGFIQIFNGLFAFLLHILTARKKLCPCGMNGVLDLGSRNGELLLKFFDQTVGDGLFACQ